MPGRRLLARWRPGVASMAVSTSRRSHRQQGRHQLDAVPQVLQPQLSSKLCWLLSWLPIGTMIVRVPSGRSMLVGRFPPMFGSLTVDPRTCSTTRITFFGDRQIQRRQSRRDRRVRGPPDHARVREANLPASPGLSTTKKPCLRMCATTRSPVRCDPSLSRA